jgi:NAD(P)H-flavin reductase
VCDRSSRVKQCLVSTLTDNVAGNVEVFRLDFEWTGPAPKPGQFFLIKPKRSTAFLARPISVAVWDPLNKTVRFLIAKRGRGTEDLTDMRPGEKANLIGPLGNCWEDFLPPINTLITIGKPIALVGGGIGVAPRVVLPEVFKKCIFDFYAGFRTEFRENEGSLRLLWSVPDMARKVIVATEDGSQGNKGRIPEFLDSAQYAAVCACGPEPMLRAVAVKCATTRTPCYISMERHMACGVGACLGCTVKTKNGNKHCCVDGPIFIAEEIDFE